MTIAGLGRAELEALLAPLEVDTPRVLRELWTGLYARGATSLEQLPLNKKVREKLAGAVSLERPEIVREQISNDGTRKWLLKLADGNLVETVYIPEEGRGAVCVSSQVGCTMRCSFCHTGTQPLVRNLTAAEIAAQVLLARDRLGDFEGGKRGNLVGSVVLMGMGEPLANYDAVVSAIATMSDSDGLAISRRRITLSTSGLVPQIERLGREHPVSLAISLHATNDALRDELVPINTRYNLERLIEACRGYPASNARRILFEYVMLDGVNDSDAEAQALVKLLAGLHAKVNLIPFNPWPGSRYGTSKPERIEAFSRILVEAGFPSPVRTPRGRDIAAACGQLKSDSVRAKKAPTSLRADI
ncbi:MAG: 23S rRNA (adenine(2503)-C(2))-methyltransferase RlmN [Myxococcota bacterium]